MVGNGLGRWRKTGAAVLLAVSASLIGLAGVCPSMVQAKDSVPFGAANTIALAQLPPQGRGMLTLIYQGGPFSQDKDGVVFGNRERILPAKNRGFYHEYTVRTAGERSRGARRIVCGGLKPAAPDACYYTDDHYASFRRIIQ